MSPHLADEAIVRERAPQVGRATAIIRRRNYQFVTVEQKAQRKDLCQLCKLIN